MSLINNNKYLKIVAVLVCLFLIGGGHALADRPEGDTGTMTTKLRAKKGSVLYARGKHRFILAEDGIIKDNKGQRVPLYKIPLPVKATIEYHHLSNGLLEAQSIELHDDITSRSRPE